MNSAGAAQTCRSVRPSRKRSGAVDQVLRPEEIAALASIARHQDRVPEPGAAAAEERRVDATVRLLRDEYAIDFSNYKASTVVRRIERRLSLNRSLDLALTTVRTVAVVEDQADARRMMQMLLESYGVRVSTAAKGAEGVALIRRVKPDLALVDLGRPQQLERLLTEAGALKVPATVPDAAAD